MANSSNSPTLGSSKARPESTVAQSFASELSDLFGLPGGVTNLAAEVEGKKASLSSLEREQAELDARLRETEQRLARASRNSSPSRAGAPSSSPGRQQFQSTTTGNAAKAQPSPLAQAPSYPAGRPPTRPGNEREDTAEMMSQMPGAMPQTPREEYVMVDRARQGGGQSVG